MEVQTKRMTLYSIFGIGIPVANVVVGSLLEWAGPEDHLSRPSYGENCGIAGNVYMLYMGIPHLVLSAVSLLLLGHGCYYLWKARRSADAAKRRGGHGNGTQGQNL